VLFSPSWDCCASFFEKCRMISRQCRIGLANIRSPSHADLHRSEDVLPRVCPSKARVCLNGIHYHHFAKVSSFSSLSSWAESGVLLLNTSLTVRAHQAGSHSKKGWETFTDAVINAVDKYGGASLSKEGVGRGVVFIAWGAWAAQRVAKLNKVG
jgi:uracil DNA glycosylase